MTFSEINALDTSGGMLIFNKNNINECKWLTSRSIRYINASIKATINDTLSPRGACITETIAQDLLDAQADPGQTPETFLDAIGKLPVFKSCSYLVPTQGICTLSPRLHVFEVIEGIITTNLMQGAIHLAIFASRCCLCARVCVEHACPAVCY